MISIYLQGMKFFIQKLIMIIRKTNIFYFIYRNSAFSWPPKIKAVDENPKQNTPLEIRILWNFSFH